MLNITLSTADLESRLSARLGLDVRVTLTDNSLTLISVNRGSRPVNLRLHHMFTLAGPRELEALLGFIKGEKRSRVLREFFEGNEHLVKRPPKRPIRLRQKGEHHDLAAIFRRLNRDFFGGEVPAGITWGRDTRPLKRLKHIRLGSFEWETKTIRVHPRLDRSFVPAYAIDAVVFHEMCHAILPREKKNGRRVLHGPGFRELLNRFPHTERADRWHKINLRRLLMPKKRGR